jgi:hypothetical protein
MYSDIAVFIFVPKKIKGSSPPLSALALPQCGHKEEVETGCRVASGSAFKLQEPPPPDRSFLLPYHIIPEKMESVVCFPIS